MTLSDHAARPRGRGSVRPRADLTSLIASALVLTVVCASARAEGQAAAPSNGTPSSGTPANDPPSNGTPANEQGEANATPQEEPQTSPPGLPEPPAQVAQVDTRVPYVPPSTPTAVIVGGTGPEVGPRPPGTPTEGERQHAEVTARPGQGITVSGGDLYSLTIRPRIQLRDTWVVDDDVNAPVHGRRNEIAIRALRLWMLGNVLNRNIKYGIQLAFGAGEFEKNNPSPLYDAFFDFTRSRVASVKVGQYFVPFDRARTIREFALQTVDRTAVVNELTLDRDVGASVYSNDLLGNGGKLGYQVGIFSGEGRNRLGGDMLGLLYTARLSFRPFGSFDEDQEGDQTRTRTPKLLIGIAGAYDQNSQRVRGTTGDNFVAMSPDYVWGALDSVFKYRGFAFMGEVVVRQSSTYRKQFTSSTGATAFEYTQRGLGYLMQASYYFPQRFEMWGRWEELHTPWVTDPKFEARVHDTGRTVSGGLNYYLNGHAFKVQLQGAQTFGYGKNPRAGLTQIMLQLDATF